jgi:hypothetical protein
MDSGPGHYRRVAKQICLWLLKATGLTVGCAVVAVYLVVACANGFGNWLSAASDRMDQERAEGLQQCAAGKRKVALADPHRHVFVSVQCWENGKGVWVLIRENEWLIANHYQRVETRNLLEKAFAPLSVSIVGASTGEPLDIRGGAR